MSEEKLRPVGRIDFLDTKGQTGESCYYYSEEDFLKTVKEENYYGVPMVVNVFRDEDGQTIPLDFLQDFDPLPQGLKILDYKEGEDMNDFRRLEQLAKQYKALYPKGTRIELQMMGSDPRPIEPGTRGTVDHVDDLGTIHCTFDNGRRLGIIPEEDSFRKLTQDELLDEQSEKLQMAYIDKVNKEVIPCIEWVGMKNAYKTGDMTVPTDLLRMLHEKYLEVCDVFTSIQNRMPHVNKEQIEKLIGLLLLLSKDECRKSLNEVSWDEIYEMLIREYIPHADNGNTEIRIRQISTDMNELAKVYEIPSMFNEIEIFTKPILKTAMDCIRLVNYLDRKEKQCKESKR